ncbi:MAG: acyl-CoA dehydrogenase family protein [Acetobacteraceae bacterium]
MELRVAEAERAVRDEVRAFIHANLPDATRERMASGRPPTTAQRVAWHRALAERGRSVSDRPAEHGGRGCSPVRRSIFREEIQAAPAPQPQQLGTMMAGPVLIAFGTDGQRRRFPPRIRTLQDLWCQGCSEPDAGSDLALLRSAAGRDGEDRVVGGEESWTTLADRADRMFALVRTDPRPATPQDGIGVPPIDRTRPGITVCPSPTIDGEHEVNGGLPDEVRVPGATMVGDPALGRDRATFLLSNERAGQARVGVAKERIARAAVKVAIGRAGRVAGTAVQPQGGLGPTMDRAIGPGVARRLAIAPLFGDAARHLRRIADDAGLVRVGRAGSRSDVGVGDVGVGDVGVGDDGGGGG